MRKKALIAGLCICIMLGTAGCKGRVQSLKLSQVKEEMILLRSNGSVQSGSYEAFDQVYYDKDGLKNFMESAIEQFNREQGKDTVKLTKLKIEKKGSEKVAKSIITYDSVEIYNKMNGVDAVSYSMKEAEEAGVFPEEITVAADGSRVKKDEVTGHSAYKVLVIQFEGNIILPDTVKYYADAMLLAPNTVETTEDKKAVIVYK